MPIERPEYAVLASSGPDQLRRYEARLVARTVVRGSQRESADEGYSRLAIYLLGKNDAGEQMVMTAPLMQTRHSESSAPQPAADATPCAQWVVQVVVPTRHTIETLPRPLDSRVEICSLPECVFAATRFSGLARLRKVEKKTASVRRFIAERGLVAVGEPLYAFYSSPFVPPPFRRNEVLIEIDAGREGVV